MNKDIVEKSLTKEILTWLKTQPTLSQVAKIDEFEMFEHRFPGYNKNSLAQELGLLKSFENGNVKVLIFKEGFNEKVARNCLTVSILSIESKTKGFLKSLVNSIFSMKIYRNVQLVDVLNPTFEQYLIKKGWKKENSSHPFGILGSKMVISKKYK